ncbi:MAG: ACT domain-containing protein [Pseudomonadota bacterium]
MKIVKQLSVFLKNRPGTLLGICAHLSEAGINILGLSVSDTIDHAVVRMIVDEPVRTLHMLGDAGVLVIENDVLAITLKNETGQLAGLAETLGGSGVNIEYAYGGIQEGDQSGILFMRVSDAKKALDLLTA